MLVPTAIELLAFLQEHEFLTPTQAQQLRGASLSKVADGRMFVRALLDRNFLTAYQANQILQQRSMELVLGPYRILDRLGEGGMGQVFKAHHVRMDRMVALKIIPRDLVSNPQAVGRFYREVRAVAKLSHPNIVTAFEANQIGQTHYLAMELVDGIDLARLIQQSGPLPIPQACELIRQAAIGLQHAHEKGLVHRDIKPGNLMAARYHPDEPPIVKILDFGLARFESESDHAGRLTQLGKFIGTVDYMSPEQAQNPRTADIRADIYSLGCSLFYLLTADPPFSGETAVERISARVMGDAPSVRRSRPEVSPALERVLAKMMARNPQDRYPTPIEVAKALKPHTRDEKDARSGTKLSSDNSVALAPWYVDAAKAHTQDLSPTQKESVFLHPESDFKPNRGFRPKRRTVAPLWIALAIAVALLGILTSLIVLVATNSTRDSKKEPSIPHRSKTVGGTTGGEPFEDTGEKGALLTGFTVKTRQFRGTTEIAFLQPIYWTSAGRKMTATGYGWPKATQEHLNVEAKDGYAVGGLMLWSNEVQGFDLVRGLRILFMRRQGRVLYPKDSYWSEWIGLRGDRQGVMLGGDGKPVIGIHGRAGGAIGCLGIIQLQ